MTKVCSLCKGEGVIWCSVRDRLMNTASLPCVLVSKSIVDELTEAKVTIRKLRVERLDLRVERDSIDQRCSEVERELAIANRRYDESRAAWARLEASLREQLAEGKEEMDRLQQERDEAEAEETTAQQIGNKL